MTEFAVELRRLRTAAGRPPYRELARRAHYSSTTLAEAAAGRRLPSLAVTVAYVAACGGDVGEWERRWRELAASEPPDVHGHVNQDGERPPYQGLASYQTGDEEWFFGRERSIAELADRVRAVRFVALFGPSGAGKSSLLRAGLVPRLTNGSAARVAVFTPGRSPVEECAVQLASLVGGTAGTVLAELRADAHNLHRLIRQAFACEPPDAEVVLVVDQFEEAFTLCEDPAERAWLISALTAAADAPNSRCRVVLGVRADFYTHCLSAAEITAKLADGHVSLGPLSADELRRAIVLPARRVGCVVESSLLTTLVAQAHGRAGTLPLLSHALLETWRRRRGNTLTLAGFDRVGLDGALAMSAEAVYTDLDEPGRQAAKNLFLRLVALGEGTEDTKRRVSRDELGGGNGETGDVIDVVIERFTAARLVVVSDHGVEVTHEVLIRAWPRLRTWLEEDRQALRVHRQLTAATRVWQEHDRDPGTLLRGTRLAVVEEWTGRHQFMNQAEHAFLDASVAARDHEQRSAMRRTRVTRALVAMLAVLAVVATSAALYATHAQRIATHERNTVTALKVARDAADLISTNPRLAAQLSLAAYRLAPSRTTRDSLVAAEAAANVRPLNPGGAFVSVTPDGRVYAAADRGRDVTVLSTISDAATAEVSTLTGGYISARFSPDSRIAATMDDHAVARLWNVADPARPRLLATLPRKSADFWFSPDNSYLATADAVEGAVDALPDIGSTWKHSTGQLWDITAIDRPRWVATILSGRLEAATFSDDEKRIATVNVAEPGRPAGNDRSGSRQIMWVSDIGTLSRLKPVGREEMAAAEWQRSVTFALNSHTLVTGGEAGTVSVWDADDGERLLIHGKARGNRAAILDMAGHGTRVATADIGGAIAVWDVSDDADPRQLVELTQHHESSFDALTFGTDGRTLQAIEFPAQGGANLLRWHLDADDAAATVCEHIPPMTESDWHEHLVNVPYQPVCE
ncbi:nSTAND1 domain-containing NTPase [Actinophytocola sp. KF-1]